VNDLVESFEDLPAAPTIGIDNGVGQLALGRFELDHAGGLTWIPPLHSNTYHALTSLSIVLDPEAGGRFVTWGAISPRVARGEALACIVQRIRAMIPLGPRASVSVDVYNDKNPVGPPNRLEARPGRRTSPSPKHARWLVQFVVMT
jgi:hypothetical protein